MCRPRQPKCLSQHKTTNVYFNKQVVGLFMVGALPSAGRNLNRGALSQQNFVDFVDFLEPDFDIAAAF